MPHYAYAFNSPVDFLDTSGLAPIRNTSDLLLRYQQIQKAYSMWYLYVLILSTPWYQLQYVENYLRYLVGSAPRLLPGSRGDGACRGAAYSLVEYLNAAIDTQDVRITHPTGSWRLGGNTGHTTVQIYMKSADGYSSMHIALEPRNAGILPHAIEAGPSEFRSSWTSCG